MKKIFKDITSNIKYFKLKDIVDFFKLLLMIPIALMFKVVLKISNKQIWLVCESIDTAHDNGYHFFKYLRVNQPQINAYYAIDINSSDYNKIKKYENIIRFGSIKHWIYYLTATFNISSQKSGNPSPALFYFIHVILGLLDNRIFLQHGVIKDDLKWLYYNKTKFRLFVAGAKNECDFITDKFGYPENIIVYTGLPRFDELHNFKTKKQILIMPTWRNWLGRDTNILGEKFNFTNTDYFENWNKFINNSKLIDELERNNIKMYFYPHLNMQKYINNFKSESKNIKIVDRKSNNIQTLLKESVLLITDYSSVFMDFAYMRKPIIYYQFDKDEFRSKQYEEGYFSYEKNGFGDVILDENKVVDKIIYYINNNFKNEANYIKRSNEFFKLYDANNCSRVYEAISNIDNEVRL